MRRRENPRPGTTANVTPMCSTCTTVVDTAATNSVLFSAYTVDSRERILHGLRSVVRLDRQFDTGQANAAFVRSLGLEPLAVLGAPPALPELDTAEDIEPASTGWASASQQ